MAVSVELLMALQFFREENVKTSVELRCLEQLQMDSSMAEVMLLHVGSEKTGVELPQARFFFFQFFLYSLVVDWF